MAEKKFSDLAALGEAPASTDLLALVDVSDTESADTGTSKKVTAAELAGVAAPGVTPGSNIKLTGPALLAKTDAGEGAAAALTIDPNTLPLRGAGDLVALTVENNQWIGVYPGGELGAHAPRLMVFEESGFSTKPAPQNVQEITDLADTSSAAVTAGNTVADGIYLLTVIVIAVDESATQYVSVRQVRALRDGGAFTSFSQVDIDVDDDAAVTVTYDDNSGGFRTTVENNTGGGEKINAVVAVSWGHCQIPSTPTP